MSIPGAFRHRGSSNLAVGAASAHEAVSVPFGITHARLTVTANAYVFVAPSGQAAIAAVADGSGALVTPYHPILLKVAQGDTISVIAASATTGVLNITLLSP